MYKKGCQNDLDKWNLVRKPKSKSDSHIGAKRNLGPKKGGKQGELARTCKCSKCIPKGWLVVVANTGSHDPFVYYNRVVWDLGFRKTQMSLLVP